MRRSQSERLRIKIPAGVKNGTVLSVSMRGDEMSLREDRFYLSVKVAGN